jgi:phospholipase/lecithinase/hemolysin
LSSDLINLTFEQEDPAMRRTFAFTLAVGLLMAWPVSSFADSISQLVVFGDSLSDTGNVYIATGGKEPAPVPPDYTKGLFTDGPDSFPSTSGPQGVWVQQLAGMMGLTSPGPSLAGGTDYAFGGALTGHDPMFPSGGGEPYVGDQLNLYLTGHTTGVPSNALYAFWAGANDIFTGGTPQAAVANLTANINTLFKDGAKDFLWLDMPPLGETPDGLALGSVASQELNLASQEDNAAWLASIHLLDAEDPGIDIVGVDVYGLVESMLGDPSAYGFANVTTPAQGLSVDPNTYLFWDGVHPTTEGHYQVAKLAYQDLTTPELPASTLLGTVLLVCVVVLGRRRCVSS